MCLQELTAELPYDSPELQFGLTVYPDGVLKMQKLLYVNNITLQVSGVVSGMEDLVIGRNGKAIIRYRLLTVAILLQWVRGLEHQTQLKE